MMHGMWIAAVALAFLGGSAAASTTVTGRVTLPPSPELPPLGPETRVCLDTTPERCVLVRADGQFALPSVPPGSHVMRVRARDYEFWPLRVEAGKERVRLHVYRPGSDWRYVGDEVAQPPEFVAVAQREFYEPRRPYSILSLLFSPYMLMTGFSLGLMLLMPRMMRNLDPELVKEMQATRGALLGGANGGDPAGELSERLARRLSGSGGSSESGS